MSTSSQRYTLTASGLLALISFVLPWTELSCADKPLYTQRGDQVATGQLTPTPDLDQLAQKMGAQATPVDPDNPDNQIAHVPPVYWLWAFPLGALLLIASALLLTRRPALAARLSMLGAALTILTILAVLTMRLPIEAEILQRVPAEATEKSPFHTRKSYGFFIALLAALAAAFSAALDPHPPNPPPRKMSGPGSLS
jgi:hypothetical protein